MKLIQVVALLCMPYCIFASCQMFPIQSHNAGGQIYMYCAYKHRAVLPVGETYRDHSDCMDCSCHESGLSCCGYVGQGCTMH